MIKFVFLILFTSLQCNAFNAKVISVIDGDTIHVINQSLKITVRLSGIDTPELKQMYGNEAKDILSEKILNKIVTIKGISKDRYGRLIGDIFLNDRWINYELINEGIAWHYKKYSDDIKLSKAEKEARDNGIGIWSQINPIAPWNYRKNN
tara:strand:- start:4 stop:453 length:450 start_codon:yes stop_codon:yes gene_type:complete